MFSYKILFGKLAIVNREANFNSLSYAISRGKFRRSRFQGLPNGGNTHFITSCCGTAIERLSGFTEFYLKPLSQNLPSFIKDSTDLINKIQALNAKGPFPVGSLLVSWDVVSMFPNIVSDLGITAVRKALESRSSKFPSTDYIAEAVEICQFSEQNFVHKHGTAMGPKNACSYADLAMGLIDEKAKLEGSLKPLLWWRYRDDIFDLWTQGLPKLLEFTDYINSLYPTIKFELVYSDSFLACFGSYFTP